MARAIWKGSISFGLVNIPVGLYGAETRDEIHFNLLDKRSMSPIKYKRVNEKSGREVPWEEIVRGYEYQDGKYVVLTDEDLKRADPEATQTVEILEFVDGDEIEPTYYDKPYYLAPLGKGGKSYALLREALARTGKVGIAKVVIRTRQYLAALMVQDKLLVLELLRFAHELRSADSLDLPGKREANDKEIQMAERLIEGMVGTWEPAKYRDDYRGDLLKMIERRVEAGETESVETEPVPAPDTDAGSKVVDLMALLKRSVEESRSRGSKSAKKPAPRKAAATKKAAPKKSTAGKKVGGTKKTAAKASARKPAAKRRA